MNKVAFKRSIFLFFSPQIIKNNLKNIHLCPPPCLTQKAVFFWNLIFSFSCFLFRKECFPSKVFFKSYIKFKKYIFTYTIFSSSGLTILLDVYIYTWYLYKMDNLLTIENIFLKQYLCLCGKHLIIFQSLGPRSAIKSVPRPA